MPRLESGQQTTLDNPFGFYIEISSKYLHAFSHSRGIAWTFSIQVSVGILKEWNKKEIQFEKFLRSVWVTLPGNFLPNNVGNIVVGTSSAWSKWSSAHLVLLKPTLNNRFFLPARKHSWPKTYKSSHKKTLRGI
jgi:hypothetical protein